MIRYFKKAIFTLIEGMFDGINEIINPITNYPQEQERQSIIKHSQSDLFTDEEIYKETVGYVFKYDPDMRLSRTKGLVITIMENRPRLRESDTRKSIIKSL